MDLRPTRRVKGPLAVAKRIVDLFYAPGELPPPSPAHTVHLRLVTISVSHYCEKARWGLELLKPPYYYTEDAHAPGLHTLFSVIDEKSATPLVILPDGSQLRGSDTILRSLLPSLYPEEIRDKIEAFEEECGRRVGATLRCHAYHILLQHPDLLVQHACRIVPSIERTLFQKMLPNGAEKIMRKSMTIDESSAEISAQELRAYFAEISDRLKPGQQYLMDTKDKSYGFTAADLTFAALAQPYLNPPELSDVGLAVDAWPSELRAMADELKATKAGAFALEIYRKHRPTVNGKAPLRTKEIHKRPLLKAGVAVVGAIVVWKLLF